ncbi:MAG TPA: hypothetical protein VGB84_02400 [Arachidicoccus sp.]
MENFAFNKDKIQAIVDSLVSQLAQDATKEKLVATAQMLVAELQQISSPNIEKQRVSVVMPATIPIVISQQLEEKIAPQTEVSNNIEIKESPVEIDEQIPNNAPDKVISTNTKEVVVLQNEEAKIPVHEHFDVWNAFGIMNEAPTITYYKPKEGPQKELNEKYNNDNKIDMGQTLQSAPIKDLIGAVGINDRYLFINELFRGDESMYERSIITLNKFHAYEQANSWIQRELHLKLGWDLNSSIAQQFERLIKRRFS